jgi:predicted dehydrogenase
LGADLAIAVVGVGVHGARYAEHLLRGDVPGARLAGVSRRSEAEAPLWRARGVRFEADAAALVADPAVDAVVVASPPGAHEAHAEAVLSRGRPLLLEKPVAPDGASCARIRAAAARAGVPVLVGHSLRYHPAVVAFRGALRGAGRLRGLHLSQRHERMPQEWQLRPDGGGALLGVGVHLADLARWITGGGIAPASCRLASEPGEAEHSAWVLGSAACGAAVVLEVSVAAPARRGALEARCDDASVEADFVAHSLRLLRGREAKAVPLPPPGPGLVPLLRDFAAAVRTGAPGSAATLEDGIAAVEFADRARALAT